MDGQSGSGMMDFMMALGLLVCGGGGVWYFFRNKMVATVKDILLKKQIDENNKQIDILETEAESIEQTIVQEDAREISDREAYTKRQHELDIAYETRKNEHVDMDPDEAAEELAASLKKHRAESEGR